jgi:hypothetical protein
LQARDQLKTGQRPVNDQFREDIILTSPEGEFTIDVDWSSFSDVSDPGAFWARQMP